MGWKVMTTARAFWVSGEQAQATMEAAGCNVVRSRHAGPHTEDELIELLHDYQAVIASSEPYNARVFAACPELRIVARCGVGVDTVNMADAATAGVVATNTPGAMAEAVADFTFAMILGAARHIPRASELMRSGGWDEIRGVLIHGKTLGLVGVGRIGLAVARRAAGFEMRVLAYDPPLAARGPIPGIQFTDLDTVLGGSDIVSVHAPAVPATLRMFNAARFAQMKPTAYFINTARGSLVDEPALIQALENGVIAGAAIDVYTKEPAAPDDPLRRAPNLLLTPHNAFNTLESTMEMNRQCAEAVLALMRGTRPENVCNPDVWNSSALRTPLASGA
jgi:phosphoglycerate dehydrogenase-like enzyme